MTSRPLRVFLCHSSNDKPAVRELYQKLRAEPWIQPWLDEEELYPGQDWNMEIEKAVEAADAIIVCLTKNSINKEGYVQRELRTVLDFADYKPEGTLYIIPVRLEECELPRSLRKWQYADYFEGQRERALQRLLVSLKRRADSLASRIEISVIQKKENKDQGNNPDLFIKFEDSDKKQHSAETISKREENLSKEDEFLLSNGLENIDSKKEGANFTLGEIGVPAIEIHAKPDAVSNDTLIDQPNLILTEYPTLSSSWIRDNGIHIRSKDMHFARIPAGTFLMGSDNYDGNEKPQILANIPYDYWMEFHAVTNNQYNAFKKKSFKEEKGNHPVVNITWHEANKYASWLNENFASFLPKDYIFRLPTEFEWEKAARGTGENIYPWGNEFDKAYCNTKESGRKATISVNDLDTFSGGSDWGCLNIVGNVWEWTLNLLCNYPYVANDGRESGHHASSRVIRGGSFKSTMETARCSKRFKQKPGYKQNDLGFRVCIAPPLPK